MMQELVDRDEEPEVSTRSSTGRRIHEFSILDLNMSSEYNFTKLEAFATIVIMLSTISGGFLEGYSSPVISSLLDSTVSTSMGHGAVVNNSIGHGAVANNSIKHGAVANNLIGNGTVANNAIKHGAVANNSFGHGGVSNNSINKINASTVDSVTEMVLANATMVSNSSAIMNTTMSVIDNNNIHDTNASVVMDIDNSTMPETKNATNSDYFHHISLHFSMEQASWFGSLLLLGAFIGAVMSSMLIKLGRRHAIILSVLPRFIGWMLIICSSSISVINCARFLTGVSVGMVTSAGPIYISEITHSSKRGAFSCFVQLGVNVGIFLAALLGASLAWKALAVCGAISVLIYAIPSFCIPNSPYWLVLQDRDDDAKHVLKRIRPIDYQIENEFSQIKGVTQHMKRNKSISLAELFKERRCALPLILVLLVTAVNRFSGYNAVISYCSTFLHHAVPGISPNWTAVAVCFIQVLATIASIYLVDLWGRRKLLISSISVMAISLVVIAISDSLLKYKMPWLAVFSTMTYVAAYSTGLGPLTWVILGEMLPLDARDKASAIVASVNWLAAFLVTKTFFTLENLVGISGVCVTYSLVCVVGGILIYLLIPETKGRTLSQIEAHFSYSQGKLFTRNKTDRNISSIMDHEFATIDSYSTFT